MNIPDFSIPSPDCFLTVDKNGTKLKAGDVLRSYTIPFRGSYEKQADYYAPIIEHEGHLVVPVGAILKSHLVKIFVESECEVAYNIEEPEIKQENTCNDKTVG